ncbi:MAG TPA: flagellar cap protein FliD N-terminal domain-containing protein, partial [Phycisphaerae bacterium]|nr:flagellar cap protein FliD N-terminal domain-containing protein [Phycisphaerae bacterium]
MSSTSIGPISGIDYGKLITGLTQDQQKQIDDISKRTDKLDKQSTALTTLATLMTSLKISSAAFTSSGVFKATSASSSNTGIINPTAGIGTPVGSYNFNVQRLASASQVITQGFADTSSSLGLAGSVKIRLGGGTLDDSAKLASLNGGSGVARGTIRITDRSGASTLVDLSDAVDINDVVDALNSTTGVSIAAAIRNDRLVITDNSGGAGTLAIGNTGGTTTATDLGLTAVAAGGTLTGNSITGIKGTTTLNSLNDGLGVRISGLTDFSITSAAGTTDINLSGAKTLADVIGKINSQKTRTNAASGVTAAVSSDGRGITLTDSGGGPITVTAASGSLAASDLGILGTSATGSFTGDQITSGLQSPLLKNLNGGDQGQAGEVTPQFGTIVVNGSSVDLTSARTVTDVLNAINGSGAGVTAGLNEAGTGLTLSSSSASFTVADGTGNLASFLHLSGTSTATATGSAINSGDEHLRYISESSSVAALSGGGGFKPGKLKITDGNSKSLVVDLSVGNVSTVSDVISRINNSGLAISARINDTGDGLL